MSNNRIFETWVGTLMGDAGFWDPECACPSRQGNVEESPDAYTITVEMPCVKKQDAEVTLKTVDLSICGKRAGKESCRYARYTVPKGTKPEHITSKLTDGVMTITIQKCKKALPTQIKVE